MTARSFIDTNILVYTYDISDHEKHEKALKLIDRLVLIDTGMISTQVLSEFFTVITRKIAEPLSVEEAEARVTNLCQIFPVMQVNEMIVLEAIRGVQKYNFSYWDALIWATARLNQAGVVFSEDFSHESYIEGVRFINPLTS
ncbi:MAG: PIN domain-containing protein [Bacillota bacterium]|nr:PIN domain-containing protein [Bacillota bacterium]